MDVDADSQLHDLEAEEARIMRELREMDEKANADKEAARLRAASFKADPAAALCTLLLECEKEVRDAKGFIADQGPPLKIMRVPYGEPGPKNATFLSRPRDTGVDFTVPVTLKAYTDLIKSPIFLNDVRAKIKAKKYTSSEEYLEDMRLLARNTAAFNKGPDLSWVVQHARFLLEAAEDAVTSRRRDLYEIEQALRGSRRHSGNHTTVLSAVGKRKRAAAVAPDVTNGGPRHNLSLGAVIEIYWDDYRKWFTATVVKKGPTPSEFDVVYTEDKSEQHIDLSQNPTMKWRVKSSRGGAAKGRRAHEIPTTKRRKSTLPVQNEAPLHVSAGISQEELVAVKDDLSVKIDEVRSSVLDTVEEHLNKMDRALLRSDVLQRVLLAVQDAQASMEDSMARMGGQVAALETKITELSRERRLEATAGPPPATLNVEHDLPEPEADVEPDVIKRDEGIGKDSEVVIGDEDKKDSDKDADKDIGKDANIDTGGAAEKNIEKDDETGAEKETETVTETVAEKVSEVVAENVEKTAAEKVEETALKKKGQLEGAKGDVEGPEKEVREEHEKHTNPEEPVESLEEEAAAEGEKPKNGALVKRERTAGKDELPESEAPVNNPSVVIDVDASRNRSPTPMEVSPQRGTNEQAKVKDGDGDADMAEVAADDDNNELQKEKVEAPGGQKLTTEKEDPAKKSCLTAPENGSRRRKDAPEGPEKADEGEEDSSSDSNSGSSDSEDSDNESDGKEDAKTDAKSSDKLEGVIQFSEAKKKPEEPDGIASKGLTGPHPPGDSTEGKAVGRDPTANQNRSGRSFRISSSKDGAEEKSSKGDREKEESDSSSSDDEAEAVAD